MMVAQVFMSNKSQFINFLAYCNSSLVLKLFLSMHALTIVGDISKRGQTKGIRNFSIRNWRYNHGKFLFTLQLKRHNKSTYPMHLYANFYLTLWGFFLIVYCAILLVFQLVMTVRNCLVACTRIIMVVFSIDLHFICPVLLYFISTVLHLTRKYATTQFQSNLHAVVDGFLQIFAATYQI